jgi:hypothetical protein
MEHPFPHTETDTEQFLGLVDGTGGIRRISMGADLLRERLGHGRSADEDLGGQILAAEGLDDALHVDHRRGQEGGHTDEFRAVFLRRGDKLVGLHVHAEVDDLEPGALHHHGDEVLADVVQVALDGAEDKGALRLGPALGEVRLQDRHPGAHGPGGDQDVRDIKDTVLEVFPHTLHARNETFLQDLVGRAALVHRGLHTRLDLFHLAVIQILFELGKVHHVQLLLWIRRDASDTASVTGISFASLDKVSSERYSI